jgi:superfamily II DNA or RNA helicase
MTTTGKAGASTPTLSVDTPMVTAGKLTQHSSSAEKIALFRSLFRGRDERFSGRPLAVRFQGELRAEQQAAAQALLAHDTGVLSATTAFGKTVIAAWLIAQRGVNTLVLVHR